MMSQDQRSDQNIELRSLLSIQDVGAQRLRSSSASSNRSFLDNTTYDGRSDASNEYLLPSGTISSTSQDPHSNHGRFQSQLSIDLEASPGRTPLDLHTNRKERSAAITPQKRVYRLSFSLNYSKMIRSLLHQLGSSIYDTSCRVVEFNTPGDEALLAGRKSTNSFTNASSDSTATSATSNKFPQRSLVIALRRFSSNTWVQPLILSLILFQLVILVVDTTHQNSGYQDRLFTFRSRWKDPCYLVIFIVYTLEIVFKSAAFWYSKENATTAKPRLTLRNVYNVLDLLALVSFWTNFIMLVAGASESRFRQILAMMSTFRTLRLLRITSATQSETVILFEALRESGPKLVKVASFICFFWLLFAVVGVQIFKSSLRRSCVLPNTSSLNTTTKIGGDYQFCGGHLANKSGSIIPLSWLTSDGSLEYEGHRGYLCPLGSVCQEGTNPYNGTVSFDNIFQSLELVFVTFSANTFSTLMYNTMDSDGLPAALFFAAVIVVLYFWLLILLIGIITGSIQEVRQKSQSAVTVPRDSLIQGNGEVRIVPHYRKMPLIQKVFAKTKWLWIAVITFGLVVQTFRSARMSIARKVFIERSEAAVTFVLLLEIVLRFTLDWKHFHYSKQNMTDLGLALVTSFMQLPFFRRLHPTYAWFTGFQIARSYRVFWAITPVKDIMIASFRYFPALLQLCGFLFLLVFLSSVMATQLFASVAVQGETFQDEPFSDLWKSFLGMYQIFTGEDWTTHLYAVTQRDSGSKLGWIGAIFVIGWFALSSIIILNMFLSRIDDSLNIPDDRKRFLQVKKYLDEASKTITKSHSPSYTQVPGNDVLTNVHSAAWTETQVERIVDTFLGSDQMSKQHLEVPNDSPDARSEHRLNSWTSIAIARIRNAGQTILAKKEYMKLPLHLHHFPKYYGTLQNSCRILINHDTKVSRYASVNFFNVFINFSIISQVIITCVTTPVYQRQYWLLHAYSLVNWFVVTDFSFALLWSCEAVVKIVAGGIILGPDAYLKGWNLIDALVLVSSWTSLALTWYNTGRGAAAFVASFKAFRVLRLLTLNKKVMREVTLIFRRGSYKVFASILVSLSLLIPFAVFGINLFVGLSYRCNDPSIIDFNDCVGEFVDLNGTKLLVPRVVSRPYYSFDDFGQSFYTLFLIVSQEGWTDVMYWARGLSGNVFHAQEPTTASNMNALFFVVFNLLGTIFVTALFASVMIQNYTEATGVAYLTCKQKAWNEQIRLLRRVHPSRRPAELKSRGWWKDWCSSFAAKKGGVWHGIMIAFFGTYLIFLCVDFYPSIISWDKTRDIILLALMLLLLLNTTIRIIGLSLRLFLKRPWDRLSLILVVCGLSTSAVHLRYPSSTIAARINSVAQIMIPLLIIPYVTAFRDLFDVAVASVPLISTLLVTWFVLLLFFAIGLTQAFGLTRFGTNETGNVNFRTVPKALILLFRLTLGEGRTKIMEDFAAIVPPYCTVGERYFESDCGDPVLARTFFIMWKVLSTYLFTSLFISLVYESFSNVYQDLTVKAGTLNRGDLRQFQYAWALVDSNGTGYISSTSLAKFTSLINGVLSMHVYDEKFSIANLQKESEHILPLSPGEINLGRLNALLETVPIQDVRDRRRNLNRYRMELLLTQDTKLGISMHAALTTLIYYNLLDSRDYLSFEEFVERETRLRHVDEALRMESVIGLIKMYRCKRILRREKENLAVSPREDNG